MQCLGWQLRTEQLSAGFVLQEGRRSALPGTGLPAGTVLLKAAVKVAGAHKPGWSPLLGATSVRSLLMPVSWLRNSVRSSAWCVPSCSLQSTFVCPACACGILQPASLHVLLRA